MSQTVIVTGAGGAIASAVNQLFAEAGWTLALFEYSTEGAERLRADYPDAHVHVVDLTDEAATREAVEAVLAETGSVEAVLNVAGGFGMEAAEEATVQDYERMFGLNLKTLFNTTRAVLPSMKEHGRGFILGVSAAVAEAGGGQMALYAASKAAVAAYLKSLRDELADDGLRVSVLYPMGAVDTPGNRAAMPNTDPSGWIDPRQLAEAMHFLATRDRRGHVRELQVFAPSAS